ncbi:MAG: sulfotransferase [Acidimicrobiia bacterium]
MNVVDLAAVVAGACDQAGIDDFGANSFREGLENFIGSLNDEAQLSELGAVAIEAQITKCLVNRLRVTAWLKEHPTLRDAPVERPIIVLGLPRTGTTLLSELFHRDPATRSLMRWEAMDSVPPPQAATFTTDPRVEAARVDAGMLDALNPGFRAIHYEAPDGPTECVAVLAQDFKSLLWECVANVPSYGEWLLACDQASAYEYHHDVLCLLQSGAPGRWALKTPQHCLELDALLARYPDARLVMTHRDPVTVVASLCSLVRSLSGTFSDADHGAYINAHWTAVAAELVERVMTWRGTHDDAIFVDVAYDDLVADPIAAVRSVYERGGDELTPSAESAMRGYLAEHPHGEHGRHRYDLDALGLDAGALRDRFATYRSRFTTSGAQNFTG